MGFQVWSHLLFLHWRVPVSTLQPLVPRRLTIDTFEGDAWIGLVLFTMSGVRPRWFPAVPGISAFHETNVRTYVHLDGQDPGVWFFSLDAANALAVRVARWRWHLNYFVSRMHVKRRSERVHYNSKRLWPGPGGAGADVEAEIGDPIPGSQAAPGTLEHFLAERYYLYTECPKRRLRQAQVHHSPYPLRHATITRCRQDLTDAAGIAVDQEPEHVLFSDGVSVEVFGLREI